MAGTIIVDRIESDASYASTINVAGQITFSNTVNFGAYSGTAPVAGFYLPTTNNLAFTTASTERMRIDSAGNVGIGTASPRATFEVTNSINSGWGAIVEKTAGSGTPHGLFVSSGQNSASNFLIKAAVGTFASSTDAFVVDGTGALKFNSGYGSAAVAYGCRAWVNFNGVGTVAIRASGNVSSITDNGVGDFTLNFTTAMPDVNYVVIGSSADTYPGAVRGFNNYAGGNVTAGARVLGVFTSTGAVLDSTYMYVAVFR